MNEYISIADAARILRRSRRWVYELAWAGTVASRKTGRVRRISLVSLNRYIERKQRDMRSAYDEVQARTKQLEEAQSAE